MRSDWMQEKATCPSEQRGIALVLVLWILAVLMVIAVSFTVTSRTDAYSGLSFREAMEGRFLAEAGIQRGILELFYRNVNKNQVLTFKGKEVMKTDGRSYTGTLGKGSYVYRVMDESGKINVNGLNDASGIILKNLLAHAGVPSDQADIIIDSILDWKDPDDLRRLNGAESDYYLSLPQPYRAKNADFDTLEELLLVRGMTPEILYGSNGKPGIIRFLTLNPEAGFAINVNVASREVLLAIPGMTEALADQVIADREAADQATGEKLLDDIRIGIGPAYSLIAPYLGTTDSSTFSIEATGSAAGTRDKGKKGYTIRAVILIDGSNSYQYVYYKSPAEKVKQ